jgi:hypothetical protein
MKTLWQGLKNAANALNTAEMTRLILQIIKAAPLPVADAKDPFSGLRELISRQDEARFVAAGDQVDTVVMAEILGNHCREMFEIRRPGWTTTECEKLILSLKKEAEKLDTVLMVRTLERLFAALRRRIGYSNARRGLAKHRKGAGTSCCCGPKRCGRGPWGLVR